MNIEQWLGNNDFAMSTWTRKYQQNGETFEEWLVRVTNGNEEMMQLIREKKFLYGGRILASRNLKDRKVTYSNCYVLDRVGDSIEEIYETAKKLARTFSYGGGVGIDISNLRPKGAPVNNAAKTTTGPVSFMSTFNNVAEVIGQEGRRGALMISMDANHPDVEDFIDAKIVSEALGSCNISVRCYDDFMKKSYIEGTREFELMNKLAKNNWDWAEPGILYWDNIKEYNLLSEYIKAGLFRYAGVNPCAEEPLPAGGSCLLGALNLSEFILHPFTDKAGIDKEGLDKAVRACIRGLNQVLDDGLALHPLQEQRDSVGQWRQIGLGIMGFADALIKLGVRYGSDESLEVIEAIGRTLVNAGIQESALLAEELGQFEKYDEELIMNSSFMNSKHVTDETRALVRKHGLRNSQLFTIAPTGTISSMLGVSGGAEPIFSPSFSRTTKSLFGKDVTFQLVAPVVAGALEKYGMSTDIEVLKDLENLPDEVTWAARLNPFERVEIQGKWQEFIDASISSTVNLGEEQTVETVKQLYQHAWEVGCKGLTIFRAGCKRLAILVDKVTEKEEEPEVVEEVVEEKEIDTDIANCISFGKKLMTGCGSLWLTAYFHLETGRLCHIFLNKGSKGGCNSYMIGLSRMISLAGRKGATVDEIVDQLLSVASCPSYICRKRIEKDASPGNCCPGAVGLALKQLEAEFKKHQNKTNAVQSPDMVKLEAFSGCEGNCKGCSKVCSERKELKEEKKPLTKGQCPDCGAEIQFTGGCNICPSCGYSKCD